jgi:hypothetical protein
MPEKADSYIEDVSMDNADNGVMVCYTERTKSAGKGTYDCHDYNRRKEVFAEEQMEDGFERFKELFMQARNHKNKKK